MVPPMPNLQLTVAMFILASIITYFKDPSRPSLKCGTCVTPYCDEGSMEAVECIGLCFTAKYGNNVLLKRCASWLELCPLKYATSFLGVPVESHQFINGREICYCNGKDYCSCDLTTSEAEAEMRRARPEAKRESARARADAEREAARARADAERLAARVRKEAARVRADAEREAARAKRDAARARSEAEREVARARSEVEREMRRIRREFG